MKNYQKVSVLYTILYAYINSNDYKIAEINKQSDKIIYNN